MLFFSNNQVSIKKSSTFSLVFSSYLLCIVERGTQASKPFSKTRSKGLSVCFLTLAETVAISFCSFLTIGYSFFAITIIRTTIIPICIFLPNLINLFFSFLVFLKFLIIPYVISGQLKYAIMDIH